MAFLKKLYPLVERILLSTANTIRIRIIEMYTKHKAKKLEELTKVKGMIHFLFDL